MEARQLVKILQQACRDGNMFEGPHTKRPMIDVGLSLDGLHLSTWWDDQYFFKVVSWEAVILSHGDAIKGAINEMRNTITNGAWSDVEINSDLKSDL